MRSDILVLTTIIVVVLVFGIGLGFSEYYDHQENLAKIERGCND